MAAGLPVVVVGAGIAGVACARVLHEAGLPVHLRERGRVVGGRMASRRLHGRPVDLGASYLTVDDPGLAAVVDGWQRRGLAHPWTDTFSVLRPGTPAERKEGPLRWGAPRGLRAMVEDLAAGLPVRHGAVSAVEATADGLAVDGEPARAVVLAMPDAQALRVVGRGLDDLRSALTREFEPVLALAAGWAEREWPDDLEGAFVNDHPVLAWLADDGRRRGDGAPVLVAHSTGELAARHLADPEAAAPAMLDALRDLLGVGEPVWQHLHRWTLARPRGDGRAPHLLVEPATGGPGGGPGSGLVGCCGDGWGATPKVEGAWVSGVSLGRALVDRLDTDGESADPMAGPGGTH